MRNDFGTWLFLILDMGQNKRQTSDSITYAQSFDFCSANFDTVKFKHIRVPETYPEYSSDKVLTMEYVPGVKITDLDKIAELGLDPVDISTKSAEAFLEQLCRHGFFVSIIIWNGECTFARMYILVLSMHANFNCLGHVLYL